MKWLILGQAQGVTWWGWNLLSYFVLWSWDFSCRPRILLWKNTLDWGRRHPQTVVLDPSPHHCPERWGTEWDSMSTLKCVTLIHHRGFSDTWKLCHSNGGGLVAKNLRPDDGLSVRWLSATKYRLIISNTRNKTHSTIMSKEPCGINNICTGGFI